jgi:hypothetical protein
MRKTTSDAGRSRRRLMFMTSRKNPVNPDSGMTRVVERSGERSFSLVETVVAH